MLRTACLVLLAVLATPAARAQAPAAVMLLVARPTLEDPNFATSVLLLVYLYAHYAFASMTAHVTAMFPAFFAVATGLGAPPLLAALALGYFSNINAAMTHYGTGPAPIIFGAGYLSQATWWRIGFLLSIVHVSIWLPIGLLWWKIIGLW